MNDREVGNYYRSALHALRFLEARQPTGRRFGSEADAKWASFKCALTTADRLDLLIRDADAQWPGTLAGAIVFNRAAGAEDDPFGADWDRLDGVEAEKLWRAETSQAPEKNIKSTLGAVAAQWGLTLASFDVGTISPSAKLIVVGPSAIAAAVEAFHDNTDLRWSDQVVVVATPAAHRQLGAIAGALLNDTRSAPVFSAETAKKVAGARLLLSPDADGSDAARAQELTKA